MDGKSLRLAVLFFDLSGQVNKMDRDLISFRQVGRARRRWLMMVFAF